MANPDYTMMEKMANDYLKDFYKETTKESKVLGKAVSKGTAIEVVKEGKAMYDSYIKYFYETYNPVVYERHDMSPKNLFYGEQFRVEESVGDSVSVNIGYSGDKMKSYPAQTRNPKITADYVLGVVASGIRGIPQPGNPGYLGEWKYSYSGKYFSTNGSTTLSGAIDLLVAGLRGNLVNVIAGDIMKKELEDSEKYPLLSL